MTDYEITKARENYQQMRLIDNELMTIAFQNNIKAVEYVIQTILNRKDLTVISAETQQRLSVPNDYKAAILDIVARDEFGGVYNIEMQGRPERATPERTRYYRSVLDSTMLEKGKDFSNLQELYIIFITDGPFLGLGNTVPIEFYRMLGEKTKTRLEDKQTVVFVNAKAKQDSEALEQLMKDLTSRSADEINSNVLKSAVNYAKEPGGENMYIDGYVLNQDELIRATTKEVTEKVTLATQKADIRSCLKNGFTKEMIAKGFDLSLEEVNNFLQED